MEGAVKTTDSSAENASAQAQPAAGAAHIRPSAMCLKLSALMRICTVHVVSTGHTSQNSASQLLFSHPMEPEKSTRGQMNHHKVLPAHLVHVYGRQAQHVSMQLRVLQLFKVLLALVEHGCPCQTGKYTHIHEHCRTHPGRQRCGGQSCRPWQSRRPTGAAGSPAAARATESTAHRVSGTQHKSLRREPARSQKTH